MSRTRIAVALALVVGAGGVGLVLSDQALSMVSAPNDPTAGENRSLPVQVAQITTQVFTDPIMAVGSTRAVRSVDMRATVAGQVTEILFAPGQNVPAGTVMLRIDDAHARAAHKAATATLSEARTALERQERLSQSGAGAQAALDAARANFMRAEADADLALAVLDDHTVTAPFDGVAGLSDLVIGQHVDAGAVVTTLDDPSVMEVAFSLPERLMTGLAMGQSVTLLSDAYPDRTFTGRIAAIDTRVDQATRSRAVRAEVANDDGALVGGMFVQVFPMQDDRIASAVPERALMLGDGETYVYMVRDDTAARVPVETGALTAGIVEIRQGLPETGAVIISNLHRLSDGAQIEIAPSTPEGTL